MSAAEIPRELLCQLCDREYTVWFAPSNIWNAVMRGGVRANPDEYPFVCPTCFALLAEERGIQTTGWRLAPEESSAEREVRGLRAELKRLRERTVKARGSLALAEQLQDEVTRLESQAGTYWQSAHEDQLRRKRNLHARFALMREAAELAWAWCEWFNGGDVQPEPPLTDVRLLIDRSQAKDFDKEHGAVSAVRHQDSDPAVGLVGQEEPE
jgi:hypothetical protein